MAFKLPSFGLLEHKKRSSAFNDFPQFSWSDLTDQEEIGREVDVNKIDRLNTTLTVRAICTFVVYLTSAHILRRKKGSIHALHFLLRSRREKK